MPIHPLLHFKETTLGTIANGRAVGPTVAFRVARLATTPFTLSNAGA